jgi:predicted  nucleic acid-binding Zn-ribbon protein
MPPPILTGCQLLKKEIELWKKRIRDLEQRIHKVRNEIEKETSSARPHAENVKILEALLNRLKEELEEARKGLEDVTFDFETNCHHA